MELSVHRSSSNQMFHRLTCKMSVWKWYVSAFLSIFIDMASLDALWETFDKGCIKIKEAHIGEVIKNCWDDTCKMIDYKNNTNVTEECNSHFYFTEYHLFHFINAIHDFYDHVWLSDNCIEDELCLVARYLFHTGGMWYVVSMAAVWDFIMQFMAVYAAVSVGNGCAA